MVLRPLGAPGLLVGVVEDPLGHVVGLAHHLGALDHPLGLDPRFLHDLVRFAVRLRQEVLTFLEHPAGLLDLFGHLGQRALEQLHQLVALHPDRRGKRHGLGVVDHVQRTADIRLGIDPLALGQLIVHVVEQITHRRTSPRVAGRPPLARTQSRPHRTGRPRAAGARR